MSRLSTMARFEEADEPKSIESCSYCDDDMYPGQDAYKFGLDIFCKEECLYESIGVENITLEEN